MIGNIARFSGEQLLATRSTPKLEDCYLRLFIQYIRSYAPYPEAVPPSAT